MEGGAGRQAAIVNLRWFLFQFSFQLGRNIEASSVRPSSTHPSVARHEHSESGWKHLTHQR